MAINIAQSCSRNMIRNLANIFYPYAFTVRKPDSSKLRAWDINVQDVLKNKMEISPYRKGDDIYDDIHNNKYVMLNRPHLCSQIEHGYLPVQSIFIVTSDQTPSPCVYPVRNMPLITMLNIQQSFQRAGFTTEPISATGNILYNMRKLEYHSADNPHEDHDATVTQLYVKPLDVCPPKDIRSLYELIYDDKNMYIKIFDNIFPFALK